MLLRARRRASPQEKRKLLLVSVHCARLKQQHSRRGRDTVRCGTVRYGEGGGEGKRRTLKAAAPNLAVVLGC